MLEVLLMSLLCPFKTDVDSKLQLDQNSIVIYPKSNCNFKATSILERHKMDKMRTSSITC
jgi:hypothetical protein